MTPTLSPASRARDLDAMSSGTLDVLVIGGGITGAGVVRDAAMRGLRVGLVERRDYASGTSSRSSKLVHGGIRYLAQGDVPLVLEAAEERRVLRRIAPHLTQPRPMMIPIHGRGTHAKLHLGLWTYEKLAGIPEAERHEMLDAAATLEREPGLRRDRLVGAALYPENLTDDARLVLATLVSARGAGAWLASYAEVTRLEPRNGTTLVSIRDVESDATFACEARIVVNAAGPWSDAVRSLERGESARRLRLTRGIHLVVRRDDLPLAHMVVLRAPDKRQVFAIPRDGVVYVGTKDTDHGDAVDRPQITRDDAEYLLASVRDAFPAAWWGVERIVSGWAGLRPLVHQAGKTPSEISRKDEITIGATGIVHVAGGKLTTYRRMAERVVDLAVDRLHLDRACATADEPLDGGDLPADPGAFAQALVARFGAGLPGLAASADRLVLHLGREAETLLGRSVDEGLGALPGGRYWIAEVDRAIEVEGALHLTDVLERRLRATLFEPDRGERLISAVTDRMAAKLGWNESRRAREIDAHRAVTDACLPV